MDIDPNLRQGRINEGRFIEFPAEHRNTFVAGMSDMVESVAKYLDFKTLAAFQPMLDYQRTLATEDLRREFDDYLANNPCPTCSTASSFLSLLIVRSGADRKLSEASAAKPRPFWRRRDQH